LGEAMPRLLLNSRWAFPMAMALTIASALLPGRWLGWTRLPAEVVGMVLGPFGHPANQLGARLRPPPGQAITFDGSQAQYIEHLRQERNEFERLFLAEQNEVIRLREDLEAIEQVGRDELHAPLRPITAHIVVREPGESLEPVVVSRGSDHGVTPGTVAVVDGVNLVGRVLDDVTAMQSRLLPLASPRTPPFKITIQSRDRSTDAPLSTSRVWQAFPTGDGGFTADVDRSVVITEGDIVRLTDPPPAWPAAAPDLLPAELNAIQRPKTASYHRPAKYLR
jgi:cell shape-determining protein MreC